MKKWITKLSAIALLGLLLSGSIAGPMMGVFEPTIVYAEDPPSEDPPAEDTPEKEIEIEQVSGKAIKDYELATGGFRKAGYNVVAFISRLRTPKTYGEAADYAINLDEETFKDGFYTTYSLSADGKGSASTGLPARPAPETEINYISGLESNGFDMSNGFKFFPMAKSDFAATKESFAAGVQKADNWYGTYDGQEYLLGGAALVAAGNAAPGSVSKYHKVVGNWGTGGSGDSWVYEAKNMNDAELIEVQSYILYGNALSSMGILSYTNEYKSLKGLQKVAFSVLVWVMRAMRTLSKISNGIFMIALSILRIINPIYWFSGTAIAGDRLNLAPSTGGPIFGRGIATTVGPIFDAIYRVSQFAILPLMLGLVFIAIIFPPGDKSRKPKVKRRLKDWFIYLMYILGGVPLILWMFYASIDSAAKLLSVSAKADANIYASMFLDTEKWFKEYRAALPEGYSIKVDDNGSVKGNAVIEKIQLISAINAMMDQGDSEMEDVVERFTEDAVFTGADWEAVAMQAVAEADNEAAKNAKASKKALKKAEAQAKASVKASEGTTSSGTLSASTLASKTKKAIAQARSQAHADAAVEAMWRDQAVLEMQTTWIPVAFQGDINGSNKYAGVSMTRSFVSKWMEIEQGKKTQAVGGIMTPDSNSQVLEDDEDIGLTMGMQSSILLRTGNDGRPGVVAKGDGKGSYVVTTEPYTEPADSMALWDAGGPMSVLGMYNFLNTKFENGTARVFDISDKTTASNKSAKRSIVYVAPGPFSGIAILGYLIGANAGLAWLTWKYSSRLLISGFGQMIDSLVATMRGLLGVKAGIIQSLGLGLAFVANLYLTVVMYAVAGSVYKGLPNMILSMVTGLSKTFIDKGELKINSPSSMAPMANFVEDFFNKMTSIAIDATQSEILLTILYLLSLYLLIGITKKLIEFSEGVISQVNKVCVEWVARLLSTDDYGDDAKVGATRVKTSLGGGGSTTGKVDASGKASGSKLLQAGKSSVVKKLGKVATGTAAKFLPGGAAITAAAAGLSGVSKAMDVAGNLFGGGSEGEAQGGMLSRVGGAISAVTGGEGGNALVNGIGDAAGVAAGAAVGAATGATIGRIPVVGGMATKAASAVASKVVGGGVKMIGNTAASVGRGVSGIGKLATGGVSKIASKLGLSESSEAKSNATSNAVSSRLMGLMSPVSNMIADNSVRSEATSTDASTSTANSSSSSVDNGVAVDNGSSVDNSVDNTVEALTARQGPKTVLGKGLAKAGSGAAKTKSIGVRAMGAMAGIAGAAVAATTGDDRMLAAGIAGAKTGSLREAVKAGVNPGRLLSGGNTGTVGGASAGSPGDASTSATGGPSTGGSPTRGATGAQESGAALMGGTFDGNDQGGRGGISSSEQARRDAQLKAAEEKKQAEEEKKQKGAKASASKAESPTPKVETPNAKATAASARKFGKGASGSTGGGSKKPKPVGQSGGPRK